MRLLQSGLRPHEETRTQTRTGDHQVGTREHLAISEHRRETSGAAGAASPLSDVQPRGGEHIHFR